MGRSHTRMKVQENLLAGNIRNSQEILFCLRIMEDQDLK